MNAPGTPPLTAVQPVIESLAHEPPGLLEYWRIVRRSLWSVLGVIALAVLVGTLIAFSSKPVYLASATLLVEPSQPKLVATMPSADGGIPINLFYETQYEIIRSRAIAESVVEKLGLAEREDFFGPAQSGGLSSIADWRAMLPEDWQSALTPAEEGDPAAQRKARALKALQDGLAVKGGQKSQVVIVGFEHGNPRVAADVANGFAKAYSEYGLESRLNTAKEASRWLSTRLEELRTQLDQSERTLESFQSKEAMVDTANRRQILSAKMNNLSTELVRAQGARSDAEIRYNQVRLALEDGRKVEDVLPLLESPAVERLAGEHALLERKVAELSERYGKKHPALIAAKNDLQESSRHLQDEMAKVVEGLRRDYEGALAKEKEAQRLSDQQQSEMRTVTGKGFQLAKLEREVEANRQLYDTFLSRFKEMDVAGDNDLPNVRVIDQAQPPARPDKPNKMRIVILSLVLGIFAGVFLAVMRNKLDNTFKSSLQIEDRMVLPVLAELPQLAKDKLRNSEPGRYAAAEPRSAFAEAINHVRTGIMFANLDAPVRSLLVTSAGPAEGKTTLASNLAVAFSQLGKTLLIDADLRRPTLRRVTGHEKGNGFCEWVSGTALAECVVQDKDYSNLHVMQTGALPLNPLEVLSSKTFRAAYDKLKDEYEYVIFDTPPVLPVSDAIVLGNLVDAVILSVRFDSTTFPAAEDMVKRLRNNGVEPLGAVLSMVDHKKIKSYYGNKYYSSYYGRYYGAYYGQQA